MSLFVRFIAEAGHASEQHGRTAAVSLNTVRSAFKSRWRGGTLWRGTFGPGGGTLWRGALNGSRGFWTRRRDTMSGSPSRRRCPSRRHERLGTSQRMVQQDPLRYPMDNSRTSPDTTPRRCRACHRDPRHWEKSSPLERSFVYPPLWNIRIRYNSHHSSPVPWKGSSPY